MKTVLSRNGRTTRGKDLLRAHSSLVLDGPERAPSRAMLYPIGFRPEDFAKPMIGIASNFTDWMHRPRLPEELDVQQGGGPVFRQASHQVDIVRYIAGGLVRSVRANVVQLDSARGAPGAYTVYLEFEDGTPDRNGGRLHEHGWVCGSWRLR